MKTLLLFCIYYVDKKQSYPLYVRNECKDRLRIIAENCNNFDEFYNYLFKCLMSENHDIYSDLITFLSNNYKLVKYFCS